ncbi:MULTISPECIES: zinc ribbon domain-containing protein [unclassified Cupriavidus]|uniref:zinc ribbon domain-containing protein n=1 Tax=unclassified Cupriavidus TaxID=2640874 RepID=UPI000888D634|nr:zinc ribbon domain-containing protein [Cupriavidus sp. YR651]SDC98485.1 putative regulatory protein, FmdB family [Cupriavidus sp. YR651]
MPTYDYRCDDCGDFALMRPIARRDEPAACPRCGAMAARALVAAPALAGSDSSGSASNESSSHGAGCACCGPVKLAGRSDGPGMRRGGAR